MSKSISHDRKITIYPETELKNLIIAECAINNTSRSGVVAEALKQRYQTMPKDKLSEIQAKADALAKYPKR
jgi:hypothetical protein